MIIVDIQGPTEAGRLYPKYDAESGVLEVESQVPRDWPYGIDVDGTLIFDIDKDCVLANFDLVMRKQLWKNAKLSLPHLTESKNVLISKNSIKIKSFSFEKPIEVLFDRDKKIVKIVFDHSKVCDMAIKLSGQCFALLYDKSVLAGFVIQLKELSNALPFYMEED